MTSNASVQTDSSDVNVAPHSVDDDTVNRHTVTTMDGNTVTVHSEKETKDVYDGTADARYAKFSAEVNKLIQTREEERQAIEDKRANHRNFNRFITLVFTIVIGIMVTYMLGKDGIPGVFQLPHWVMGFAPYSFCITVTMDLFLTGYAFIRHY